MDMQYFSSRDPPTQRLLTTKPLTDDSCLSYKTMGGHVPIVIGSNQAGYWIHDARFVLQLNSREEPLPGGGGSLVGETQNGSSNDRALCANVPRSWLNENKCFLSSEACRPNSTLLGKGVVVCGSPGEVANDLSLDGETLRGAFDIHLEGGKTGESAKFDGQTVWVVLALIATDQLRQRTAWALSQILVSATFRRVFIVLSPTT